MFDIFSLIIRLQALQSQALYPYISGLDNYDPTFDNYKKPNKKDEDSEMTESSTLNTLLFSKEDDVRNNNKIEFDFGKNEDSEKDEYDYEKSKKMVNENSDKDYDYVKKSKKTLVKDNKLYYDKNNAYNTTMDHENFSKDNKKMYGKNQFDFVNPKKLYQNERNKPLYSHIFFNTPANKNNNESVLFSVNPPLFTHQSNTSIPNAMQTDLSQDVRPTFAYHNSEEPYESSDQNEPIRSITRSKINTSPKNLNNVLHKELGDVSADLSNKVEQAIRNVSKQTPQNYKEIIIIKKRILSDGKTKVVNLNVREKVVPKTKIEDTENDFGTRALIGGVLFLIAGLIFTTSLKIYQTHVKHKFIKKEVKETKQ
ncbi:hypothetical protein BDAP_001850 [Binucleata daphniae]